MLKIKIPGMEEIIIHHLLLDYNGTLACDGVIKSGVLEQLEILAKQVTVHVITADTYGSVQQQCDVPYVKIHVIGKDRQDVEKLNYLQSLGSEDTIAIGNGLNDALILQHAALGFALLQEEGCYTKSLLAGDVVFKSINDALDALLNESRLIATLRS